MSVDGTFSRLLLIANCADFGSVTNSPCPDNFSRVTMKPSDKGMT